MGSRTAYGSQSDLDWSNQLRITIGGSEAGRKEDVGNAADFLIRTQYGKRRGK
ncbi:hypothetical protein F511_33059 [Dorcoceras hygrometricum]|uniref:Uncharacterized protein n=1 Tax=Dorcoceras hygrometricum TaxID=472368 RepID=A0A2Z7CTR0_9LAMI|nr:hypothetical protein F511_33059 [Dorcoceras hygrometricum]